jgi:hypothetical protein
MPGAMPEQPPQSQSAFSTRRWWNQGTACKVLVVSAWLGILMLFQPWEFGVAGKYTTEPTVGSRTGIVYGVQSSGGRNAFAQREGWIPFFCLLLILYFCGQPREKLGGRVWLPFIATIVLLACAVDAFRTQGREVAAWLAGLDRNTSSRAEIAAAIYWTNILGFIMSIAAYRHAAHGAKVKEGASVEEPPRATQ